MEQTEREKLIKIIDYIHYVAYDIETDWTDPRGRCAEIEEACIRALELIGAPCPKPNPRRKRIPMDKYLRQISGVVECSLAGEA